MLILKPQRCKDRKEADTRDPIVVSAPLAVK